MTKMVPQVSLVTYNRVLNEINHAYTKHGPLTKDTLRATAILGAEAGEALDAALDMTRLSHPEENHSAVVERRRANLAHIREELAQVAATAILILENLQEENP